MNELPKKSHTRETLEAVATGAAGMVPIVGPGLAAAFGLAMGWSYNERMTKWFDDLATAVDEFGRQMELPRTFEQLAGEPVFVDAVIHATRAAQATHQEEKLAALRNAVLRSTGPGAPSVDEQARFFRLIDDFTPAHLVMLQFLQDPGRWFDDRAIDRPTLYMGARGAILEVGIPEFKGCRDWYDLVAGDLSSAGLANPNLQTMMSDQGVWSAATTPLGNRFLDFVSDPRAA